jgi:hypothetical protein
MGHALTPKASTLGDLAWVTSVPPVLKEPAYKYKIPQIPFADCWPWFLGYLLRLHPLEVSLGVGAFINPGQKL